MNAPTLVSQVEFARLMGIARSRVHALKDAGRLVMVGDQVDVEASRARIEQTRSPSHDDQAKMPPASEPPPQQTTTATDDDGVGNSYQAARAVKERYLALEAKRAYLVACGQLMRVDDVVAAVTDAATNLRTRLEALPDQIAAQISPQHDEAQRRAIAAELTRAILSNAAADFEKVGRA